MASLMEIIFNDLIQSTGDEKKIRSGEEIEMTIILSKCIICGQFFDSKKQLRTHKDKAHRITDSKMMSLLILEKTTIKPVVAPFVKRHPLEKETKS